MMGGSDSDSAKRERTGSNVANLAVFFYFAEIIRKFVSNKVSWQSALRKPDALANRLLIVFIMTFQITQDPIILTIVSLAILASAYLIIAYRGRIRSVTSLSRDSSHEVEPISADRLPGISVIVYEKDSPEALGRVLADIFRQEYGGFLEVIVASDGNSADSADVVNLFSRDHDNIHYTFVPDDAHALSRKKLAITLGVKGARYDCVVVTEADCRIESDRWLAEIGGRFASGHSLVVGHCAPMDFDGKQGSAIEAMDTLMITTAYLSASVKGKPYRANACNMGFSRRLFFDNKGFANSLGLHYGEDDIFVSRVAPYASVATVVSPQSTITLHVADFSTMHRLWKLRHNFTCRYLRRSPRLLWQSFSAAMWLWLMATVAVGVVSGANLLPLALCVAFGVAWMICAVTAWRGASRALSVRVSGWMMPLLMFAMPVYDFIYKLRARSFVDRNYTWSKP